MSQREIKFRVWYKAESRYLSTPDGLFFEYPSSTGSGEYIGDFIKDTDVYETEQYTGLNDAAGRGIYEGDIVRVIHIASPQIWTNPKPFVVSFQMGAFNLIYPNPHAMSNCSTIYEIVGDVHQSPELLA